MERLLLYILLITCCSLTAMGTTPLRQPRTRLADGTLLPLPYSSPHAKEAARCCPSQLDNQNWSTRALYAPNADGLGNFGESARGILPSIGSPRIPIIMIEFADVSFRASTTAAVLDSLFNHPGYKPTAGARGSVRDYFVAQSYGMFRPSFEVVGKVKTTHPRAYYGQNLGNSKHARINDFYLEALEKAKEQGVDFSQYATQGNVPIVVLYHAGAGEHDSFETGRENYIWAHFSPSPAQSGKTTFRGYFVGNELMQTYQSQTVLINGKGVKKPVLDEKGNPIVQDAQLEGIGVLCHELCHALGLPDFYSTEKEQQTPTFHDLMDYGQYGNSGYRPVGLSAYERNYLGWLKLEELGETPLRGQLAPLGSTATEQHARAYIVRNKLNPKEYYILENRQPYDWFFTMAGSGMLVYHIDYDEGLWRYNRVNTDGKRLRYTVLPADGLWQGNKSSKFSDYAGDFFPGTHNITTLTSEKFPLLRWHTDSDSPAFYQITQAKDGSVAFSYLDKTLGIHPATATSLSATLITLDGRRIAREKARPGVYLQEGKKIVIR